MKNYLTLLFLPNIAYSHAGNFSFHMHMEGLLILILTVYISVNFFWRKKRNEN